MKIDSFNQAFKKAGEKVVGSKKKEKRRMGPGSNMAKKSHKGKKSSRK